MKDSTIAFLVSTILLAFGMWVIYQASGAALFLTGLVIFIIGGFGFVVAQVLDDEGR